MQEINDKLIVALDVDTLEKAKRLVDILYPTVKLFKVGNQLFTACGSAAVEMIGKKGARVFLDLKFHDIPNTVYSAVASGTSSTAKIDPVPTGLEEVSVGDQVKEAIRFPVFMMTVHIQGGKAMLEESMKGATDESRRQNIERPFIVGVTVLTSDADSQNTLATVIERVKLARGAGLDGAICSVNEAAAVREECGKDFLIVTPGIRPAGAEKNDQKRTATPKEAIKAGANFIVVGRPILEAQDPLKAAENILEDIKGTA